MIYSLRDILRVSFVFRSCFAFFLHIVIIFVFGFLFFPFAVFGMTFPSQQGYVTDSAGILSAEVRSALEQQLFTYEQQTSNEIAVVTISSLSGESLEDYSVRLFEQWKIGKSGKDNGVLLLVSFEDRLVRIEVGYGLESVLTDGECGMIIRTVIAPKFRNNDYDGGIRDGVQAIINGIASEESGVDQIIGNNPVRRAVVGGIFDSDLSFSNLTALLFIMHMLFIYLAGYMARTKSIYLGGIVGGFCGFLLGLVFGVTFLLVLFLLGGILLGLLIDWVLSRNYRVLSSSGAPTDWFHTFGGFGGARGFGGFRGGGFGGFGGGRSGGGGASGGW